MFDLNKMYENRIDAILDTDTFNEIDDQFAIAYMLKYNDKINVKAITIAPFFNFKVKDVAESIEKSYKEALKVLSLCDREDLNNIVIKGSTSFLKDEHTYIDSEACDFIIKESQNYNKDNRLYIIAIGAITNVASAILKDPTIADRISVIWLGCNDYDYPDNKEFNMCQDIASARVVMSKCDSLALLPCMGVVSHFRTNETELVGNLKGKGKLADYLCTNVINYMNDVHKTKVWTKAIWDVSAIGFVLNNNNQFMSVEERKVKLPTYPDGRYCETLDNNLIYVTKINRDELMFDLFKKIKE